MSRKRLFSTAFIALALLLGIILIERALSNTYWNIPETDSLYQRIKQAKAAATFGPRYDILILGDSTGEEGVIPKLLEQQTGKHGYNVATTNYEASVADVYLLEEYLDHHPAPQGIIVVRAIIGLSFKTPYGLIREFFERPDIGWFLFEKGFFTPEQLLTSFASGAIPSFGRQYHLHRVLFSPTAAISVSMILESPVFKADGLNLGYLRNDHVQSASDVQRAVKDAHQSANEGGNVPLAENLALLTRLCEVATEHRIPAIFVSSAYMADMKTDPVFMNSIQEASTDVRQALAGMPDCTWHGPEALPSAALSDLIHPNNTGAILFTRRVGDALLADLAAQELRLRETSVHMHAP